MKTTKASNYLAHTRYEFTDYHIKTANNINTSNAEGKLRGLGHLTNSFSSGTEREFVYDPSLANTNLDGQGKAFL